MLGEKIKRLIITITVAIILLIILHYLGFLRPIENLVAKVFNPIQKKIFNTSVGINYWYHQRLTFNEILEQNKKLEEKISLFLINQVNLEELKRENEELKKLFKVSQDKNFEIKIASIIGHTVDGLQNTYLLDIGRSSGVEENYPVIAYDGILVGKIIKVHERTAILQLITDNDSKVAVALQNESNTIGLAQGQHNINMVMNLIPHSEVILEEQVVITSGIEPNIPRGFIVGVVDTQITKTGDLFKSAIIRPIISFDRLTIVGIPIIRSVQK